MVIKLLQAAVNAFNRFEKKRQDECYLNRTEEWNLKTGNDCPGTVGGTWATDYLSEMCVGCPHMKEG